MRPYNASVAGVVPSVRTTSRRDASVAYRSEYEVAVTSTASPSASTHAGIMIRSRRSASRSSSARPAIGGPVVAQEQLLERRRVRDEVRDAGARQAPQRGRQLAWLDLLVDRAGGRLGLDGDPGQVTEIGQRAGLHRATRADDGHAGAQRL